MLVKKKHRMDLKDKCPVSKQIDNMDDTIKELNSRIGE